MIYIMGNCIPLPWDSKKCNCICHKTPKNIEFFKNFKIKEGCCECKKCKNCGNYYSKGFVSHTLWCNVIK